MLDPHSEAAVFLWLMQAQLPIRKLGEEAGLEYGWLLDNIYNRLSQEARDKVAGVITASAFEKFPQDVPVEAVASPRTLQAIAKDKRVDIEPLLVSPPPWEGVKGFPELAAILAAHAPGLSRVAVEHVETAFSEPVDALWDERLIEDSHWFDRHKVRRYIYNFRREFIGYIWALGHDGLSEFLNWLNANRSEVGEILGICATEIYEALAADEPDTQHKEYTEPISSSQIEKTFHRGYFGQDPLRIKLYYFLKAKSVKVPALDRFLRVHRAIKHLLADAARHTDKKK
jgi:hypothetical protein